MYDKNDPRSALTSGEARPTRFAPAQYCTFYDSDPQIADAKSRTWISRGQNIVLAYTDAKAGAELARTNQPDEYGVLLADEGPGIEIITPQGVTHAPGNSVVFVPPGDSTIRVLSDAAITRVFSPRAADLAALASNADAFTGPHPTVPDFVAWPEPVDGHKVRVYSLDVPPQPGRFGRIFRCTTVMINVLDPRNGPRPKTQVSPHHHDDFEQCSLALSGEFTHHLRWPWTTDMTQWREDEHVTCGSPSICIIPPPVIHTTTAEGVGINQMVDIFAPPRLDFSSKPGWIINEADYPLPVEATK